MLNMFRLTGVPRPKIDVDAMEELATAYGTASSGFAAAHGDASAAVAHVLSNNDGPAAMAFSGSETGDGSITHHLGELAGAARRTESAYRNAASAGGSAKTAMEIMAKDRSSTLAKAILQGADPSALAQLLRQTKIDLTKLEMGGAMRVNLAFYGLGLPGDHVTSPHDERGRLDPRIADEWQRIYEEDPERAEEILQQMADDYADANGLPRVKIQFTQIPSDPGWITYGDYKHTPRRLRLHTDVVGDPNVILNTVIHEMEHARQYEGMESRWPWQDEKAGMSREEAERWRVLNDGYVRDKGDDPDTERNEGYGPRPIEVGARDAGRDYVNNLSWEEFEERYL